MYVYKLLRSSAEGGKLQHYKSNARQEERKLSEDEK